MASGVFLLLAVIIWGWTFVATKICLAYVSPLELLGLRLLIGLPVLLVIVFARRIKFDFTGQRRPLAIGSLIITLHFLIQITGIKYTSATNTGWIIALTPLVTAVLAFFILKEKINRNTLIGIAVATAGILFLISKGDFAHLGWLRSVGDWLVLASAHTWALYTIATRDLSRSRNPLTVIIVILIPCAIITLGMMAFTSDWSLFVHLPLRVLLALAFLGLCGTALAQWFWLIGLSKLGAAKAGVFLYIEPLATTGLAVPYLHESFGVFTAIGGGLVLFGVWYAQRKPRP